MPLKNFILSYRNAGTPDERVTNLLKAIRDGTDQEMEMGYYRISRANPADTIPPLISALNEVTAGVPDDMLILAARMPLPPNPNKFVAAAKEGDLQAMKKAIEKKGALVVS